MPHIHEKIDFTASVFIVNGDAVLLRMHEKFNKWLQPGGHIELDEDPPQAALREAKEETGLDVTLTPNLTHAMPANDQDRDLLVPRFINRHAFGPLKPGHEHVDFIYFGTSTTRNTYVGPGAGEHEKLATMRWFTRQELNDPSLNLYPSTLFYAKAALDELAS